MKLISLIVRSSRAGLTTSHPNPIDPHSPVRRLIEAFEEVLDLGQHLFVSHVVAAASSTRCNAIILPLASRSCSIRWPTDSE